MVRGGVVTLMVIAAVVSGTSSARAESKPLKELPKDVVRWSTLWVEVPKQMVDVGQEYGPLAALTWGPAKGTAMMIRSTTEALWGVMKPDKRPRRVSKGDHPKGLMLRYEF